MDSGFLVFTGHSEGVWKASAVFHLHGLTTIPTHKQSCSAYRIIALDYLCNEVLVSHVKWFKCIQKAENTKVLLLPSSFEPVLVLHC